MINIDRYDDREIIKTNLVESYDQLLEFARKHLPDKFFLEDTVRKSLRNTIVREMVGNTLMHREFTSSYTAKFVIEKERMYVENANRALKEGYITMDNLEPNPKNPIIASFFRNIGYADQLGSGVRNLFKYTKFYSGKEPEFIEGDVFRIIVPLDDAYSFDFGTADREKNENSAEIASESAGKVPMSADKSNENETNADKTVNKLPISINGVPIENLTEQEKVIIEFVYRNERITSNLAEALLEVKQRRCRDILRNLVKKGILEKQGQYRNTIYILRGEE